MEAPADPMGIYDVTARKAHQIAMVLLCVLAFIVSDPQGGLLLLLAGGIMLVGRFWWPADFIRQFVWRVAEPAGLLPRVEREEDHTTRRLARVLGGIVWLAAGVLVVTSTATAVAWLLTGAIAVMVALDATLDFCALCFVVAHVDRLSVRA